MSRPDLPDHAAEVRRALDDPRRLCAALGLDKGARRQRAGLTVLCPWHSEKTPSCSVTIGPDGTVRVCCFGCGATGDALSLVAVVHGFDIRRDFREVLRAASELAGVYLDDRSAPLAEERRGPNLPRPAPVGVEAPLDDATFAAVVAPLLSMGRLDESPVSVDVTRYLAGRGLLELARADEWAALPSPGETQRAWVRMLVELFGAEAVRRSGLAVRAPGAPPDAAPTTFSVPSARVAIPWRDPDGRIYTLQRRRLDDGRPKYASPIGRSPRWPYGVHRLAGLDLDVPVAIVEGAVDALALAELERRRGRRLVALGIPGVGTWTPDRGPEWAALAAGRVAYVALDVDATGERAVETIAADLDAAGAREVRRAAPRRGKDWADMLTEGSES